MSEAISVIPRRISAGDTLTFRRNYPDYPAGTWALSLELVNASGKITIDGASVTADGDEFVVLVAASTTASYTAGDYHFRAYVTSGSTRYTVERGTLTIDPDFSGAAADRRSHAEKTLAAIEAVIEGRASKDQESYQIAGRSLTRTPLEALLKLKGHYEAKVAKERRDERRRRGLGGRQVIRARLA